MDRVRDPRAELDALVPYDAKDIKAEVVLASNEHPSQPARRAARVVLDADGAIRLQPLSGSRSQPSCAS